MPDNLPVMGNNLMFVMIAETIADCQATIVSLSQTIVLAGAKLSDMRGSWGGTVMVSVCQQNYTHLRDCTCTVYVKRHTIQGV